MTASQPPDKKEIFVGVCFAVKLDKDNIGTFTSCEGLGLEVVMEQREEGGKLTKWIVKALNGLKPTTGVIQALDPEGKPVVTWSLDGVIPVRWTGPSLNLDSPKVFTETLEIAHHGFNPEAGSA